MSKPALRQALQAGEFVITAEVAPPKGTDVSAMIDKIRLLAPLVNAINITDNQASVMRLGSLGGCKVVLDQGVDAVFQLCCRDRNRLALQSDLLSAHTLGIKNVLAITGDYISLGDHPQGKPVFDIDSVHLLQIISRMNNGEDMMGNRLKGALELYPGSTFNPNSTPSELQHIKLRKKIQAGAMFFQTQPIFDVDAFLEFIEPYRKLPIKILAGVFLLRSSSMIQRINHKVPGFSIPKQIADQITNASDPLEAGIDIAARVICELKNHIQGIHLMAFLAEEHIPRILARAGLA